jgi:cation transport protein ChaC
MWVFGYGSLMHDGWEIDPSNNFQGIKHTNAKLNGYERDFNKASIANWGTRQNPCPTLGLNQVDGATCIGCAFEFDDTYEDSIMSYLQNRERAGFQLLKLDVELENGQVVQAVTPVNLQNHESYIGNLTIETRAQSVANAAGTSGSCVAYIDGVYNYLRQEGIDDAKVNAMWEAIH